MLWRPEETAGTKRLQGPHVRTSAPLEALGQVVMLSALAVCRDQESERMADAFYAGGRGA